MPRIFKILSGKDVVKILEDLGYVVRSQTGSHFKMLCIFENNSYIVVVPNHKHLSWVLLQEFTKK